MNTTYMKLQDSVQSADSPKGKRTTVEALVGTWINTNKASRGITRLAMSGGPDDLNLRVYGAAEPEEIDWGEAKVESLFTADPDGSSAVSFTAAYDFEFLRTELQANLARGLLIVTTLNTFRDNSGRSDYFAREFYYRQSESA